MEAGSAARAAVAFATIDEVAETSELLPEANREEGVHGSAEAQRRTARVRAAAGVGLLTVLLFTAALASEANSGRPARRWADRSEALVGLMGLPQLQMPHLQLPWKHGAEQQEAAPAAAGWDPAPAAAGWDPAAAAAAAAPAAGAAAASLPAGTGIPGAAPAPVAGFAQAPAAPDPQAAGYQVGALAPSPGGEEEQPEGDAAEEVQQEVQQEGYAAEEPDNIPDTFPGQCGQAAKGTYHTYEHGIRVRAIPNLEACCDRCNNAPLCLSWSWVEKGVLKEGQPECWLKSGKRISEGSRSGLASGIVPGRPEPRELGKSTPYQFNYQAVHTQNLFNTQPGEPPAPPQATTGGAQAQIRVLTYNLFWWNLFDRVCSGELHCYREHSEGNGATELLKAQGPVFDAMAFQECMDLSYVMEKAGMADDYTVFDGEQEICMAYKTSDWSLESRGQDSVAEDDPSSYWRKRDVQFLRLRHLETGKVLLFMNHHGPLPISSGGVYGGQTTAYNIAARAAAVAQPGDTIVILGDFNAGKDSATVKALSQKYTKVISGSKEGGIDHIFTNLDQSAILGAESLGGGGSDHDAVSATLRLR